MPRTRDLVRQPAHEERAPEAAGGHFSRSTRKLKQGIRPLGNALDRVRRLRGVSFTWVDDAPPTVAGRRDLGFIAEEVSEVVPEIVAYDVAGAPIGLDYARLTAVLVEAVKEQQRQIDSLRQSLRERGGDRPERGDRERHRHGRRDRQPHPNDSQRDTMPQEGAPQEAAPAAEANEAVETTPPESEG
jgi:hypothetical protein